MKRRIGNRSIELSRLDKTLFPDDGITKGDLIDYYERVSARMVVHVRDRLLTMERFPNGIDGQRFFQKDISDYFPRWIDRKTVGKKGGTVTHVVCNKRATLVYLANQACITMHAGLGRIDRLDKPDQVVLDLDPAGADFDLVRHTAQELRELFDELGLASFVKVTGSRGLHVVVPLKRTASSESVAGFARDVSRLASARRPQQLTVERMKSGRAGRLYVDWLRNGRAQTAVAAYSVRARPGAPVALPLAWEEVGDARLTPDAFSMKQAAARVEDEPDPWSGWGRSARSLTKARGRLDELLEEAGL
jgi:bifunctional non-homologous end joining protein LigD